LSITDEQTKQTATPIAIVGMGCVFPGARNLTEFWRVIREGRDCITEVPPSHWKASDYLDADPKAPDMTYCARGGFLPTLDFDPTEFGIPPTILEATDTAQLISLVAAKAAMDDAGYGDDQKDFRRERVSVVVGVTGTQELVLPLSGRLGHPIWRKALADAGVTGAKADEIVARIADGYVPWQENSFPGLLGNVVAGRISNRLNLQGTNCVVDAACASSLSAIHMAMLELETGRCDMAVAGGADTLNDIFMYMCFSKTPALSPTGDARPFSDKADGTVLGEGVGYLVLKRLPDAERDGDRIYSVIRAIGTSSDGRSQSIYAPHAAGQERCLRDAYERAGVDPSTIGLIEAHGTGTKVGDVTEMTSLGHVFDDARQETGWCAVGSVKSQIGHTKAAAGVAGLMKAALAIYHRTLPPTIKVDAPNPKMDLVNGAFHVSRAARPWLPSGDAPRRAGISAFGFGGSNYHAVLDEHPSAQGGVAWDGSVQIAAFSAASRVKLIAQLDAWIAREDEFVKDRDRLAFAAQESRRAFDANAAERLLVVIDIEGNAISAVQAARVALQGGATPKSWTVRDAYYGTGTPSGGLAMVFPGQGSQYVNMGRDLACVFPEILATLHEAEAASEYGENRLYEAIYPKPSFDANAAEREQQHLTRTDMAQPALGAVELGMYRVLQRFGVRPDAAAGHSYGELPALAAAGRFDVATLFSLSRLRGRLMADGDGGRGAMLAVKADRAEVEQLIAERGIDLVVANHNSPKQTILSGAREQIGTAVDACKAASIACTPLNVSGAFHSPLMQVATAAFANALASAAIQAGSIPVYANVTAQRYGDAVDEVRDLLTRQLVSPVEFVAQIERMQADGISIFVEVGPRRVLTGLTREILGSDITALAVDASGGRKSGVRDLAVVLCQLAAEGRTVDLRQWERPMVEPRQRRMSVALNGANLRTTPAKNIDRVEIPGVSPSRDVRPSTPLSDSTQSRNAPASSKSDVLRSGQAADGHNEKQSAPSSAAASSNTTATRSVASQHSSFPSQQRASDKLQNRSSTQSSTSGSSSNQPRNHNTMTSHQEPHANSPQRDVPSQALPDAIRLVQQGIAALQDLQRQTAEAHQRFLEGQEQAQRSFQTLIEQQQSLLRGAPALPAQAAQRTTQSEQRSEQVPAMRAQAINQPATQIESLPAVQVPAAHTSTPTPTPVERPAVGSETAPQSQAPVASEPARSASASASAAPIARPAAPIDQTTQQAAPAKSAGISRAEIEQRVTDVVCDKTGYPAEMIEMGMDIEADLGVDSIKRVEIVAALEESIPEFDGIKPDYMGQIRTLAQIVDFVEEGVGVREEAVSDGAGATSSHGAREAINVASPAVSGGHASSPIEGSIRASGSHSSASAADMPASEANANTGDAKRERFVGTLMEVVADLTGYPQDMLELPMDMEADLGIDSIKRVEILAAVEGRMPDMPTVQPEYMGSLRTLAQIVDYCVGESKQTDAEEASGNQSSATSSAPSAVVEASSDNAEEAASQVAEDYDSRRRVVHAVPIAAPQMSSLPVPTDAEVWVTDDGNGLSKALVAALEARGHAARLVSLDPNFAPGDSRVSGLIVVAPQTLAADGLWSASSESFLKNAFALTQALSDSLLKCAADGGAILATVSRMDGRFGLAGGDFDAVLGGLPGLPKTAMREWQQVTCRAFDVAAPIGDVAQVADQVLNGFDKSMPIEMGVADNGGWVSLDVESATVSDGQPALRAGDTLLVTGGARGVTAECAVALAQQYQPRLVLMGRTAIDVEEPEWLAGLSDEREIKQAIKKDAQSRGEKLTPQELKRAARQVAGRSEIRANLDRMRAAGADVHYVAVDICDAASVARVIGDVQRDHGPIRGLIHGAGRIEDKLIRNKTTEQFAAVLDTKVAGLRHVLTQLELDDLRAIVMFSSVSGRCGNIGQVDYSMANEALNKIAQSLSRRLPAARVTSLNWGPWDGGMVTPALKREFENHGVDLIPMEGGAQVVVDELANVDEAAIEIVIGYSFDMPAIESKPTNVAAPMRIAFERDVNVSSHPVLAAHVMNDRAVLPAALMMEWMAHAATTSQPGLRFAGIDRFRLLKGVVLGSDAVRLRFAVGSAARSGETFDVPVELRGVRADGGETLHARATVVLTSSMPTKMSYDTPAELMDGGFGFDDAEIYGRLLFHGAPLQAIERVVGSSDSGLLASLTLDAAPARWMAEPVRSDWLTQPLAIDAAFQAAILWCRERRDAPSLPAALDGYRQYVERFPTQGVSVALQVTKVERHQMVCNIAFVAGGQLLARITGYQCTVDASLASAFARNRLIQSAGS